MKRWMSKISATMLALCLLTSICAPQAVYAVPANAAGDGGKAPMSGNSMVKLSEEGTSADKFTADESYTERILTAENSMMKRSGEENLTEQLGAEKNTVDDTTMGESTEGKGSEDESTVDETTAEDEATITISTVEEFLDFAENCKLDTWSKDKTFVLTADLDLGGKAFTPIPTFGGTFLGEGHTISGLKVSSDGSNMGLFRFIQMGASVRDLHVTGLIVPDGSASNVGGIAGSNSGSITNCSFDGRIRAKTAVGGIVGQNEVSGEVTGCTAKGSIIGEDGSGGIAGRNLGVLLKCENYMKVNTSAPNETVSAEDVGSAITQLVSPSTSEETGEPLNSHTDTGGVTGYSSGILQNCVNYGAVGYNHVGYNVGGVAGRQCGYMLDCFNNADVRGRKDVGGIVGQAEPDIFLNTEGNTLAQLRQELNALNSMTQQAIRHVDANRTDISDRLVAISDATGKARDNAKVLMDSTGDFANSGIESINSLTSAVTTALGNLTPALDSLAYASDNFEDLGRDLDRALDNLDGSPTKEVINDAKKALDNLRTAKQKLSDATQGAKDAAASLQQAVLIHDHEAVKKANSQLAASIKEMGEALEQAHTALDALRAALRGTPSSLGEIAGSLGALGDAAGEAGTAMKGIGGSLETITNNTEVRWEDVRSALASAKDSLGRLGSAAQQLDAAMADLQKAAADAGPMLDAQGNSISWLSDAANSGSDAAGDLRDAFQVLGDTAYQLSSDGDVSFAPMGQNARTASDGLYNSLVDMSGNLTDLKDVVSTASDTFSADMRAISSQITKILNLMLDVVDSAQNVEATDDLIGDVSEEDIDGARLGKAAGCANTGTIEGDRNIGGIAGAVAVEYSLDPEDDAPRLTFGSTYEVKAILQNCVNSGDITGKRDCVGGAAGRMDIGTATGCENYGNISGGGAYAGGLVGYADAAVRNCWVKCRLSGTEYVGGIAGWGNRMTGCRAIASIDEGTEYLGSIAGNVDMEGDLAGNCFVDMGTGGIDGVSYAGMAEPISYESLCAVEGIPSQFLSFSLTLKADEETVAVLPFNYGDDLSQLELPDIPEKEGYYSEWPELDPEGIYSDFTLEAVYTPWVTLAASAETDGNLSLALAEGRFTEEAVLSVADAQETPPDGSEGADVWEVVLSGADIPEDGIVPIRLLNRGGGEANVWQLKDGNWQMAEFTVNGSYLCLDMTGTSGVFCIVPVAGTPVLPIVSAAAIFIILIVILRMAIKHRKKKKTEKTEKKEKNA